MTHKTTLVYSESLLRTAVWAYWRRSVGLGFGVAMALVAISLVVLLAQGERSWVVGVFATVLLFGVAAAVVLYVVHLRNALRVFRAMGRPEATFHAEADTFTVRSGAGAATLPWSAVEEVWPLPEVWLLLYSKAQFSTLPTACLSPEMQAFVVERVRAAGGRVAG